MSEPSMTVEAVRDIHTWFGLTYSSHLVLPRVLLQSMPEDWQARFVAALDELRTAFEHIDQPASYKVTAAEEREAGDLTGDELRQMGITRREVPCTVDHDHDEDDENCNGGVLFDSYDEADMDAARRVLVPCADPLPAYNRGRTHIPPLAGGH